MIGDKEKSQIDLYDLYGYLVPGSLVLILFLVILGVVHKLGLIGLIAKIGTIKTAPIILGIVFFLVTAYVLGHVLASIGVVFFDKIIVGKIIGYPSQSLFNHISSDMRFNDPDKNFYRFATSLLIFINIWAIFGPYTESFAKYLVCVFLLEMIILLALFSFIKAIGSIYFGLIKEEKEKTTPLNKVKTLLAFLSKPFSITEAVVRNFLGTDKQFSPPLQIMIKEKFNKHMGPGIMDNKIFNSEFFWITQWIVAESSPHARDRLYKFVALYGMTRNTSVAMMISSLLISLPNWYTDHLSNHLFYAGVICFSMSIALGVRYYYLYYNYYSKSLFFSYLTLNKIHTPSEKPNNDE